MEEGLEPPPPRTWTPEDEAKLLAAKSSEIDIEDTALGRHKATLKRELDAAVDSMKEGERASLRRRLDEADQRAQADSEGEEVVVEMHAV